MGREYTDEAPQPWINAGRVAGYHGRVDDALLSPLPEPRTDKILERLAARPDAPQRVDDPDAFLRWAAAADDDLEGPVTLSRYLAELRSQRPDLLDAYPQVPGVDVVEYREWARVFGREQVPLDARFVPDMTTHAAPPYMQAGVNLAGFLTAELGVGELARRLAVALRAGSIPFATTTFERTTNRTAIAFAADTEPRFDTNLVCVNADSWGRFAQRVGPCFFTNRYTIAVWFWETSSFPSMFHSAFRGVDEIWAASSYIADILRSVAPTGVPVREFPAPVLEPANSTRDMRALLGLPPGHPYFLTSFDHNSIAERKNPFGAIRAFREAFPQPGGPLLVVKSINGDRHPDNTARLRELIGDRDDIVVHDGYLDVADNGALIAQAAAFVSLHRAEGYGFNIVDAMALGVPVVATAYSGNMAFTGEHCWLVPAREIAVGPGQFPYEPTALWGDPDLAAAARHLIDLAADPAAARARAALARAHVLSSFTPERTGLFIRNRIAAVRATREEAAARLQPAPPLPPPHPFVQRARRLRDLARSAR